MKAIDNLFAYYETDERLPSIGSKRIGVKMKKSILLVIMCIFVPLVAIAENKSQIILPAIAGTYEGIVLNGNDMDPVLTTFFLNESDQIVGKYAMGEEAGLEVGELSNLRMDGSYTVLFDWKDKYGRGVLRILFSSNYKMFYGLWGKTESETFFPWNGAKK